MANPPEWASHPCLYILKMPQESPLLFRVGASGTKLYKDADPVYGMENPQNTGLHSRMRLYHGFYEGLQVEAKIHAALTIPRQLIAGFSDRVEEDSQGNLYNVTRPNRVLVLQREAELHEELDRRGFRWDRDRNKELFTPNNVNELISAMRTIEGMEMYVFNSRRAILDEKYKGGRNRLVTYLETAQRKNPTRPGRDDAPVITIKLSKEALQQLKSKNIVKYDALIELVLEAVKSDKQVETKKRSKKQIDLIRNGDADEIVNLIQPVRGFPQGIGSQCRIEWRSSLE